MKNDTSLLLRVTNRFPAVEADVVVVLAYVVLSDAVFLSTGDPLVRTTLGLPFVFFLPGYAFLLFLCPGRQVWSTPPRDMLSWPPRTSRLDVERRGVSVGERAALSFGLSLALIPLLAVLLTLVGLALDGPTIVTSLGFVTVLGLVLGAVRRRRLPYDERFQVTAEQVVEGVHGALFETATPVDTVVNVVLALTIVVAVSGLAFTLVVPNNTESYSELSLLTEQDSGKLVASGYPAELVVGEPQELVVSITNEERAPTDYTVVVELQRVRTTDGSVTVLEQQTLQQFSATVDDGETWQRPHTVSPTLTGDTLRLTYLLYKGDAPSNPTVQNAYRSTYIWVSVTDNESANADVSS